MARTLGVDSDLLEQAMENAGGPNADMNQLADQLGVSVEALKAALPGPGQ